MAEDSLSVDKKMVMLRSGTRTKDKEGAEAESRNGSIQDVGSKRAEESKGSSGSGKVSFKMSLYFYPCVNLHCRCLHKQREARHLLFLSDI